MEGNIVQKNFAVIFREWKYLSIVLKQTKMFDDSDGGAFFFLKTHKHRKQTKFISLSKFFLFMNKINIRPHKAKNEFFYLVFRFFLFLSYYIIKPNKIELYA